MTTASMPWQPQEEGLFEICALLEAHISLASDQARIWQKLQHYARYPDFNNYLVFLVALAQEWKSQSVKIYRRGGSELTATTIDKELGSTEIQVWEDVNGVMTCDPAVCTNAMPQPYLTYEEAEQIMIFGTQSMQLAKEGGITIKVMNLHRPEAPGTVITRTRDTSKDMLTSIVLKSNIIMLNIKSKRVLAQSKFVAMCISTFENEGIVFDYFASSGDRISAIVASSKQSTRELVQMELGTVVKILGEFADVDLQDRSIISLVGHAHKSTRILVKAARALDNIDVDVKTLAQLPAKEDEQVKNVSFVVKDNEAKSSVRALHSEFFVNSSAEVSSSNEKRKMDDDHPEAPPRVRQLQMLSTDPSVVHEVGGCSSGAAPNVLNENELTVPANCDHQWFSRDNGFRYPLGTKQQTLAPHPLPSTGYPLGMGQHTFPYPPPAAGQLPGAGKLSYPRPAAGYQTSAGGENDLGICGGDGGGYSAELAARAPDGDDRSRFNEDCFASLSPL